MFNIGGPELLVILLVALLVLGPNKLPEAARQVGRAMHELRRLSNGFQEELRQALEDPSDKPATRRSVVTGTKPPPGSNRQGNGSAAAAEAPAATGAAAETDAATETAEAAETAGPNDASDASDAGDAGDTREAGADPRA